MKRWLAAGLLLLALPALALGEQAEAPAALEIVGTATEGDGVRTVRFEAQLTADAAQDGAQEEEQPDPRALAANALLDARFEQERAAVIAEQALARGGSIWQRESVYADERVASIGLIWEGRQADGLDGCSAYGLTLDLSTGEELTFDGLFADADAIAEAMEAIIERDIVWELSDYMAYADVLPMPRDCFWFDGHGFTVGYGDGRYRYFSGRNGTVHFSWYELAPFIDEASPLWALSRPQPADAQAIADRVAAGRFGEEAASELPAVSRAGIAYERDYGYGVAVGDRLGDALEAMTLLADPDYTRDSKVYLFEDSGLRGYALEIPRYADTSDADTPISAVRASRISWHGLTTGETVREDVIALLGEPERTLDYSAQDADYAMLEPGESLLYGLGGNVLEAHLDEDGVLSCLILRASFPERLY